MAKKNQTIILYKGLNRPLRIIKLLHMNGGHKIHTIQAPIRLIPNNLFVTDRKIAYSGKKYHSGTICAGVIKEFAILKLSECPKASGSIVISIEKIIRTIMILKISFTP